MANVRPHIPEPVFVDDDGRRFRYGERWDGSPPDWAYSNDSHPERFAPLHDVARALVADLAETYDVTVDESSSLPADLAWAVPVDVVAALRVVPAEPDAAPLTIVLTAHPGVTVLAGVLYKSWFPRCGCDACDEDPTETADDLERLVADVAAGRFEEWVRDSRRTIGQRTWSDRGRQSGDGEPVGIPASRLAIAEARLRDLAGPWRPWPRLGTVEP